jgi:hypothetical protein
VFVFAPDDISAIREKMLETIRDNVLFEFGLALGKLGTKRAFFLVPEAQDKLRLPSDLLGIHTINFSRKRSIDAALESACITISNSISQLGMRQDRLEVELIKNPKILCTCSPWYYSRRFEEAVELISKETSNISPTIFHLYNTNPLQLTETLTDKGPFDIIHIAAYVDLKTGDVYFCDSASEGIPSDFDAKSIAALTFCELVKKAKARLVVLAICDSLLLGAKLAKTTNMIAGTAAISVKDMLEWELLLYRRLSKGVSLSNSFEIAASLSKAPMLLLLKRDIAFTAEAKQALPLVAAAIHGGVSGADSMPEHRP